MTQAYSDPDRVDDALPDIEVFELTARECALMDEDTVFYYLRRFPLALMNGRAHERMVDAIIEEQRITGGWFWCFPGCLPDSEPIGPFATYAEALADAQSYND